MGSERIELSCSPVKSRVHSSLPQAPEIEFEGPCVLIGVVRTCLFLSSSLNSVRAQFRNLQDGHSCCSRAL